MNLHLRVLATAFVAAIAVAAVAAPSASAFEFFKAEEQLAAFRGIQSESADFKFTTGIGGGEIICLSGTIRGMYVREGTETNPQKTRTLDTSDAEGKAGVEYTSCKFGIKTVTYKSNHCNYRFHAEKETVDVIKNGTAAEELECEGSGMTFSIEGGCTVSVKPVANNVGRASTNYKNNTEKTGKERFFYIVPAVTKLTYTASAGCLKPGTFEDGEYLRGTLEVFGYTGTGFTTRAGLWME
jgi:hypothetical protein